MINVFGKKVKHIYHWRKGDLRRYPNILWWYGRFVP